MEFEIVTFENMQTILNKYAFKYDLCENQRSVLRIYVHGLLTNAESVSSWDVEEICKLKKFSRKK